MLKRYMHSTAERSASVAFGAIVKMKPKRPPESPRGFAVAKGSSRRTLSQNYFRRRTRRYIHWRIDRWLKRAPDFQAGRRALTH